MVIFDTNAILRYILQDNQTMADAVELQLSDQVCYVPVEVVCEIVYVLSNVYGLERSIIAQTLTKIADVYNITFAKKAVVLYAFQVYSSTKLDFVDCLLTGYAKKEGNAIFTFDKKLQNYLKK